MLELIYSITLHGMPPSKKNSKRIVKNRRTKKPMLISSENYKQWEGRATCNMALESDWNRLGLIDYPVKVSIQFDPKDKRRRDLSNMAEGVLDCLVDAKVLADDNYNIARILELYKTDYETDNVIVRITKV